MKLQQQPLTASESGWAFEWPTAASNVYGVRYSIVVDDSVVAEAIAQQVPDATLAILFTTPLPHCSAEAVEMILVAASQTVQSLQLTYAYLFLSSPPTDWLQRCLQRTGFQTIERVLEFRRSAKDQLVNAPAQTQLTFWQGTPHTATAERPFSAAAFDQLITNIVTESADLPKLPRPGAAQLQMLWRALNADVQLTVACVDRRPIGLAVISRSAAAKDELAVVEYLGIHENFRHQGVGNALLTAATDSICTSNHPSWITSFVAEGNSAARDFFTAQGFVPQSAQQLWAWRG